MTEVSSPSRIRAIDPESDDFIAQFDREFGPPALTGCDLPAPEPPPEDFHKQKRPYMAAFACGNRIAGRVVRRPYRWMRKPWGGGRVVRVIATTACLAVTTFIMMRVVHWDPFNGSNDLINDDVTPTGGDMGSHVWGPAYLRDHLLPNWQLTGWSMDWYGGLPVYRFYMLVPALAMVILDAIPGVPYGVAFKYVAIAGLVTLPLCCWAFGRLARFRYPMPELFAFGGICFALNESYTIFGGNVLSTMAGEFSFSIALSLMVLGWGLLARGLDDGTFPLLAPTVLALAGLSHGIVLIYTVVGALVLVACRLVGDLWRWLRVRPHVGTVLVRRLVYASVVGGLTLLLSAFWVGPFLFNHDYMTDMKYGSEPGGGSFVSFWEMFFDQKPVLDFMINTLAVVGFAACVVRRHVHGIALGLIGVIASVAVFLTRDSLPVIGLLWNPRVLPLVYLARYLMMIVGAVEIGSALINYVRNRPARAVPGVGGSSLVLGAVSLVVLVIFGWIYQVLPFGGHITEDGQGTYAWGPFHGADSGRDGWTRSDGWSSYNFKGYENRPAYPEYHSLMQTMIAIGAERGCGRALWENNKDSKDGNGRYGTTMALMLLPFWTDGCIGSSEGLYFEASATTPYHFLTAAAMSRKSSNPVRQLRYVNNDATVGVPYLQALGVQYLMVHTSEAVEEADGRPELTLIDQSGPWRIYQVAESDTVVPLDVQPVVVNGRGGDQRERFLELGTSWFQNQEEWAAMPADDGPAEWQHIDVAVDDEREATNKVSIVVPVQEIEPVALPAVEVSEVVMGEQDVSFDVSQVGVPVLVRVSYFPNWNVDGAEGPYRIGPNQMVVIPTETHVRLHFDRSNTDLFFYAMTLVGMALVVVARISRIRKRSSADRPPAGATASTTLAAPTALTALTSTNAELAGETASPAAPPPPSVGAPAGVPASSGNQMP